MQDDENIARAAAFQRAAMNEMDIVRALWDRRHETLAIFKMVKVAVAKANAYTKLCAVHTLAVPLVRV
jgi:hypothetical protein